MGYVAVLRAARVVFDQDGLGFGVAGHGPGVVLLLVREGFTP
jgi:hypothetical protein